MAKTTMRASDLVDRWEQDSYALIAAATDYVTKGEADESASANIRRIRVVTSALQGALNSIQFMPRTPALPTLPPDQAAADHGSS